MPSLLEAIEGKYGLGGSCDPQEALVSIFVPKLPPRLLVPDLLVLNGFDIDCAGEPDGLRKKCSTVKELDLAQNKLKSWNEVFSILSHMPRVEFVNLSLNLLSGPVEPPPDFGLTRLRSLVLNNTRLDWESVEALINSLDTLEELHLSLNDYHNVLIDTLDDDVFHEINDFKDDLNDTEDNDTENDEAASEQNTTKNSNSTDKESVCTSCGLQTQAKDTKRSESVCSTFKKTNAHNGVKKLQFSGNPVSKWHEICRLGRVFPNLESLVLAECPLKAVEPIPRPGSSSSECSSDNASSSSESEDPPHQYFQNLTFLNLSNTDINTWDDIDRLAKFPALRNLRVQNWPLWEKCDATEHERRQLLIARLPHVQTLNGGGKISSDEREDAERAFIRYYVDKPESDRPERYAELITIHGKLDPLVKIDLRPEKRVKVTFTYGDTSEIRPVDVYRTVVDLKSRLERLTNIPATKMRLFYVDQDLRDTHGPEEMKYMHKQLYSYNIRDGDEIIIDQKR